MPELLIDNVTIRYDTGDAGGLTACQNVTLDIAAGTFVAIVGRSGCGKTSLLHAIDGLLPLADGEIRLSGQRVTRPGRDRAMVFQAPTLFPWLSVTANVKFGAEAVAEKSSLQEKANELISLVGLAGFESHYPHQLSGGMQQRVNLARALAVDPDILLLDEPFSALDAQTRELMQQELLRIWSARNEGGRRLTAVFVTHDISEAVYLADVVVVLSARPGRVREEVMISLPRPRDLSIKHDPEFQAHGAHIAQLLEDPRD